MSYYNNTEEQQFNEVKNWFKQNGTSIVIVLFIIAASMFGWRYWQNYKTEKAQTASAEYQQVMDAYSVDPVKNRELVQQFIADHNSEAYAAFSLLALAKSDVDNQQFESAQSMLKQALAVTSDVTLRQVVMLRLAKVQYQLKQYDEAINTLNKVNDKAWDFRKNILLGDILVAQGHLDEAKQAYQQAQESPAIDEAGKTFLELRLNNL